MAEPSREVEVDQERLAERVAARTFDRALNDVSPLIERTERLRRWFARTILAVTVVMLACAAFTAYFAWSVKNENASLRERVQLLEQQSRR